MRTPGENAARKLVESVAIPGLVIDAEIGRGAHSVVYRALRDGVAVALKVFPGLDRNAAAARRFRCEASALAQLRHPALPRVLEVGDGAGTPFLVMQFMHGRRLQEVLLDGALSQEQTLRIAAEAASALAEVHRRGLVHRDLKPENILLDDVSRVKVVDFGFAAPAVALRAGAESIAATLLYAAPEQCGMLKRPVDARADLYALGVVLFECLTGHPPFVDTEIGALVRHHTQTPAPDLHLVDPSISPVVAAVIGKLLRKDPDDRYRSAAGLLADLERIDRLAMDSNGAPILGSRDDPTAAADEAPLIGREAQWEEIDAAWKSVQAVRHGAVLQVTGDLGAGKTRLVREFLRSVHGGEALVFTGRCAAERLSPLAPFREALEGYLERLERSALDEREAATARLRRAAGEFAGAIKQVSPRLAVAFADAPAPVGVADLHTLLDEGLSATFVRLAAEVPVILFVDDVDRADVLSMRVLAVLAERLRDVPLLLIGAARTAAGGSSPLSLFGGEVLRIDIPSLTDEQTEQLVRANLGGDEIDDETVRQIALRAHGSPFAVAEVLRALLDSGRLRPHWGRWELDRAGLERVTLPEDAVQLVTTRLRGLSDETRAVLRMAALIGARFRFELLRAAWAGADDAVLTAIGEASAARVVDHYAADEYAFVHDCLQEALLAELAPEEERGMHRRIASALERVGSAEVEDLFAEARHCALGARPEDALRVHEINLAAGHAARDCCANHEAHAFLEEALRAARAAGLAPTVELHEALGEVSARLGRLDEALLHFDEALRRADDPLHRAELRTKLAHVHLWGTFDAPQAREQIERAFAEVGVPAGAPGLRAWVAALRDWWNGVATGRREGGALHGADWERIRIVARLFLAAVHAAFLDLRPGVMFQTIVRSFAVAARLGPSRELANLYALYATVVSFFKVRPVLEHCAGRARQIADDLGDPRAQAQASLYLALARHYAGDARASADLMRRCLTDRGAWLDAAEYVSGCSDLAYNLVARGYSREALEWFEKALRRSRASEPTRYRRVQPVRTAPAAILATLGRGAEGWPLVEQWRQAPGDTPRWRFGEARLYGLMLLFYLEQGDLGGCEEVIGRHRALELRPRLLPVYLRSFYLYQAQVRLVQWARAASAERARCEAIFAGALRELKLVANAPVLRSHFFVLRGAGERLRGRIARARRDFARAESLANEHDCPWVVFEVARQRAHLLAKEGGKALARQYAQLAHRIGLEHGWLNRARWIREEFPGCDLPSVEAADARVSERTRRFDPESARVRRYLDALLQINLAAARVDDFDSGARAALDEIVRVLGAERAFLFLCRPETEQVERGAARDAAGNDLEADAPYGRAVVEQVRRTRSAVVMSGTEEGSVLASESVVAQGLRSILAAPLLLQDRLVGILYLDNRLAKGVFGSEDVEILLAIGSHIAITLDKARTAMERDRAAQAVRESEQNFRSVFDNLVDIFYRTDLDGTVRMISPSVERYGHRPAALIGRPVMDFYEHKADRDRLLTELLANGAVTDFEALFKRGDGAAVPVSMSARLIFDDAGRPCGMEGLLRDISERKHAEEQLEQSRSQLRALSNRLVSVQEEERKRIARDLHDELGQVLTALSLDLSWLAKRSADVEPEARAKVVAKIAGMATLVDDTISTVQRISRELRPLLLDDLGLVPALQWLVREFEERSRIACTLRVPARGVALDRERGITVFRLVQEALTNVARHSGASRVEVAFRRHADRLALTVEDDGRGIRNEEIADPQSLGLAGMSERVRLWGGTIRIEGKKNSGTRLNIELPMPKRGKKVGGRESGVGSAGDSESGGKDS